MKTSAAQLPASMSARVRSCASRIMALCALVTLAAPALGGSVNYVYDSIGRLHKVGYDDGKVITYTLDPAGNRTLVTVAIDDTAPTAATGLTASAQSATSIRLDWTAATDGTGIGVVGYRVERCVVTAGNCTFADIGQLVTATNSFVDTALTHNTTYRYRIRAVDGVGLQGPYSNEAEAVTPNIPDYDPPTAPGSLQATSASSTRASLSWVPATDTGSSGLALYRIERCQGAACSNFTEIGTIATPATSYDDNTTQGSTQYIYRVGAEDGQFNRGPYSNVAGVTTPDTLPPTVPGSLAAEVIGATQIRLSWTASTEQGGGTFASYRIERCTGAACQDFALVTHVGEALTTYSDNSVVGTTTYRYRVRAMDVASNISGWSNIATGTTPTVPDTTPPSSPDASATSPNSNTVIVNWTVSTDTGGSGLAGYKLWKCTGTDCSAGYTQIGGAIAAGTNTYTDTAVIGSTWYHYYVTSFDNAGNEGPHGATANIQTGDSVAPSTPTNLVASSTSSTLITLNWTASTDTGGSGLAGYRVERCAGTGCSNFTLLASPSGATHADNTVSAGTSYSYRVRAIDGASNFSGYSNIVTRTPADSIAPSAPASLAASSSSSTAAGLTWTGSTDTGGSGMAGYRIERCAGSGCSNYSLLTTVTGTSYTDNSVSGSTTYNYRVNAIDNANNQSGYSNVAPVTTPDTLPPTVPANLTAAVVSATRIDLGWSASTDQGGGTLASYRIERCIGAGCSSFALVTHTANTSYSDTSVTGTTTYQYRVRAQDVQSNVSAWSNTASATTPALPDTTAPSAPDASATSPNSNSIVLSWTTATDTGGSGLAGYRIWRCVGATCTSGYTQLATAAAGTNSYTDTTVSGTTWYHYYVTAYDNAANEGTHGAVANIQTADTIAPSAPASVSASSSSSASVTVSWSASTDTGGSGLANYRIERCTGAGCSNYSLLTTAAASPYNDSGVSGTTSYRYRVAAVDNASNQSAYTYSTAVTTPDTIAPSPPTITATTPANSNRVDLAWSAGSDSGGSGLALYRIERCTGSGCGSFSEIGSVGAAANGFTDNTTAARTTYNYRVRSQDGAGNVGSYSNVGGTVTPDTLGPTVPGSFSATATSISNVALSWTVSTDVGGGTVASYRIERCVGSGCSSFSLVTHVGPSITSYNDTSVSMNTTYRYRIRAMDTDSNVSDWTPIATATTPAAPDTAPPPTTTVSGTLSAPRAITLNWSAVTDTGGSGLAGYQVWRCPQADCSAGYNLHATVGAGTTTFTDSNLAALTWHRYFVKAVDNAGNVAPQSNVVNIKTQ